MGSVDNKYIKSVTIYNILIIIYMTKNLTLFSIKTSALSLIISSVPVLFSYAQSGGMKDINDVTDKFNNIGNTFIQILIAFAFVFIIFNVVRYLIVGADSEDSRAAAKHAIMYGVIGLFIILSIWGLVNILRNTFMFQDNNVPTDQFPSVPTRNGNRFNSSGGYPNGGPGSSIQDSVDTQINPRCVAGIC
jgi:uncharacterized membrane protein YcfT